MVALHALAMNAGRRAADICLCFYKLSVFKLIPRIGLDAFAVYNLGLYTNRNVFVVASESPFYKNNNRIFTALGFAAVTAY